MRTKLNFCGIVEHSPKVLSFGKTQIYLFFRSLTRTFATAFIAATIILVSSCSQDDDYYDSDMYTMAEKLETRAGEGGGTPNPSDTLYTQYEFSFESAPTCPYNAIPFTTLIDVKFYRENGEPVAKVLSYGFPVYNPLINYNGTLDIQEIYFTPNRTNPFVYNMYANASIEDTVYVGMVENILFH
mgnify:CR=1 FL=1